MFTLLFVLAICSTICAMSYLFTHHRVQMHRLNLGHKEEIEKNNRQFLLLSDGRDSDFREKTSGMALGLAEEWKRLARDNSKYESIRRSHLEKATDLTELSAQVLSLGLDTPEEE